MIEIIAVSIGVGLAISLLFSEVFGLAAGGMVVPGYFALFLNRPIDIALTIACALGTYFIVKLMSTFIIIYGKRRTVLMILVGYLLRALFDAVPLGAQLQWAEFASQFTDEPVTGVSVIGYIIPGLVAIWVDRQGMVETLSALTSAAVVVRLILILAYGTGLNA